MNHGKGQTKNNLIKAVIACDGRFQSSKKSFRRILDNTFFGVFSTGDYNATKEKRVMKTIIYDFNISL